MIHYTLRCDQSHAFDSWFQSSGAYDALRAAGHVADEASILRAIQHRDHVDSTRAVGPLRIPTGADRVDTSHLDLEAVVSTLEHLARERLGARLPIANTAVVRH